MSWNQRRYDEGVNAAQAFLMQIHVTVDDLAAEYFEQVKQVDEYEVGYRTYVRDAYFYARRPYDAAKFVLRSTANSTVWETAERLVAEGKAEWVVDDAADGVYGLVKPGTTNAWLVVYTADMDFEESLEFVELQ